LPDAITLFSTHLRTTAHEPAVYDDKQEFSVSVPVGTGQETRIRDTASAKLKGVELDVTAVPADRLTLIATLGHIDARCTDFIGDVGSDGIATDNTGLKFRRGPKWTWSIGANL